MPRRMMQMSDEVSDYVHAKYTPKIPPGWRHIGNSGETNKEKALKDYRSCIHAGEEIKIEPFFPDGEPTAKHPFVVKWALFAAPIQEENHAT